MFILINQMGNSILKKKQSVNSLSWDIWGHIIEFIERDQDKCKLLMTCKNISNKQSYFHEPIDNNKIMKSRWYDNFTQVVVGNKIDKLPVAITHLYFSHIYVSRLRYLPDNLPMTITHLIYGSTFKYENRGSILHKFRAEDLYFTKIFKNNIPSSVTHLTLNSCILLNKKYCIPKSITHLTLGLFSYVQPIADCVPSSLKELVIIGECDKEYLEINKLNRNINVVFRD